MVINVLADIMVGVGVGIEIFVVPAVGTALKVVMLTPLDKLNC